MAYLLGLILLFFQISAFATCNVGDNVDANTLVSNGTYPNGRTPASYAGYTIACFGPGQPRPSSLNPPYYAFTVNANTSSVIDCYQYPGTLSCTWPPDCSKQPGTTLNTYTNTCDATCPIGPYPTPTWVGISSTVSGLPDMCLGGCVIGTSTCGSGGGKTECQLGNVTGAFCDPSKTYANQASGATTATNTSQLSPEAQCLAKGQSYGYVNQQVVCVAPMDGGATPVTQTKGSAQPGQQYTQTTTDPTTQTVNTTNYTVNTSGGGTTTVSSTTQTQVDFCAQNPNCWRAVKITQIW